MGNSTTLREWFARVDSAHTGNITAPQLKALVKLNFLLDTPAFYTVCE